MPGSDQRTRPADLRLYTREGCRLCAEAIEQLEALRGELRPFSLELVDIESDPELHARLLERIPVAEADGELVFELFFDREAVLESLGAAGTV